MKTTIRFFFFVVLGLNLCICSCSKEESDSDFTSSDLIGMWVPVEHVTCYYWEFTKDKHINYYELDSYDAPDCYFEDGTLYYPTGYNWELVMYDDDEIVDNCIFFNGINMGQVTKINKNKFLLKSDMLYDGYVERVKRLKTFDK